VTWIIAADGLPAWYATYDYNCAEKNPVNIAEARKSGKKLAAEILDVPKTDAELLVYPRIPERPEKPVEPETDCPLYHNHTN
jgi:hypothetical protein